jgi:hypothetical protein
LLPLLQPWVMRKSATCYYCQANWPKT